MCFPTVSWTHSPTVLTGSMWSEDYSGWYERMSKKFFFAICFIHNEINITEIKGKKRRNHCRKTACCECCFHCSPVKLTWRVCLKLVLINSVFSVQVMFTKETNSPLANVVAFS